jgi:FXSXX-COOH protein
MLWLVSQSQQVDASGDEDLESDLVDLTDMPLAELRVSGDSVLAHALRRLVEDVSNTDDVIAGFQSAI